MDYKIFIPVLVSFALSAIMGPVIIPVLRNLKMGQTEREEGVKEHLKKAGTPTMGGVIILLSILITSLFYIRRLSADHSGTFCDDRVWPDRIPG